MKNPLPFVVVAVLIAAGALAYWQYGSFKVPGASPMHKKTMDLHIGALQIKADVADTPRLREKGLSGRDTMVDGEGMWFVFGEDGVHPMWMKDMRIALDIMWVDASSTIVHIEREVRPESYPQAFSSPIPARFVLEVPAGFVDKYQIETGLMVLPS